MIKSIKSRMHKDEEEGFTLIELLVVVLILGILMAIAIPTFLSITSGAKANAAEADLTTAAQDEATYFTTNGVYGTTTSSPTINATDAGINWLDGTAGTPSSGTGSAAASKGTKQVAVNLASGTQVILTTLGSDGKYYWVDMINGVQTYAITTTAGAPSTIGTGFQKNSWSTALSS